MMTHKIIQCYGQIKDIFLKKTDNSDLNLAWKSKGFSDESIKSPAASCYKVKLNYE